jgi:hypothetical protein
MAKTAATMERLVSSAPAPRFVYNVKYVCGIQKNPFKGECTTILSRGIYSTEINILNFGIRGTRIIKLFIPLVMKNEAIAREPKTQRAVASEVVELPALSGTMDDCCKIAEILKPHGADDQLKIGYLEIVSPIELEVTAVYTVTDIEQNNPSVEVVQVQGKKFSLRK